MTKRKFLKMGWLGWTFTAIIAVTLIGSLLFFFNIFNVNAMSLLGGSDKQATEADELSKETVEQVEETRETVGEANQDIGQFVSETHDFYNETTGYGGISSLDWNEQEKRANTILSTLDEEIANINDEALTKDLKQIQGLANAVKNEEKTENIRTLHRMFHDLDIALNDYNAYDVIWNATNTLEATN
ncbi:hypothetical protein [Lentibacillus jeotgali]|uniref:hypothetical protein n=1 Tax=Lentibacillus jeotgali TaxID=558169 RepID=UPI0002626033|nr:hypothetical protein [Lentibacillus jeotgali]